MNYQVSLTVRLIVRFGSGASAPLPNPRCASTSVQRLVLGQQLVRFLVGFRHASCHIEIVHKDVLDCTRDYVTYGNEVTDQRTERCRCVLRCSKLVRSNLCIRLALVPTLGIQQLNGIFRYRHIPCELVPRRCVCGVREVVDERQSAIFCCLIPCRRASRSSHHR